MCKVTKIQEEPLTPDSHVSSQCNNKYRLLRQFLASCAISLGGVNIGSVNGWSGGALIQIDEEFDVTSGQLAVVVSALPIGSILGSLFAAKLTDVFGRKKSLLFVTPVLIIGWLFIALSPSIEYVIFGRIICGIAAGVLLATCNVYISEISSPEYRGTLGSINTLAITFGIFLTYTAAGFLNWRFSCFCFVGLSVVMFFCILLIPESPYWYLRKGRNNQAITSIKWLRGKNYDFATELKEMLIKIEPNNDRSQFRELLKRRSRIPLMIGLFVQICQQMCGGNIIMMFTSVVLKNSNSSIDVRFGTMYAGISQLIGTIISIMIIDRIGRKPLLIISLAGVSSAMFFLGLSFHMGESWPTWTPLVTILLCLFVFCLGLRSIPWIVCTEILNTSVRSTGTSICVLCNRIISLMTTQIYPYYRGLVGDEGVFLTYGCLSLTLAIMVPFILPETSKKSLEEIQEYFENRAAKNKKQKENDTAVKEELV